MQTKHCPHVFLNTSWRHFWRASENEWKSSCFHLHPPHGWPGWLPEAFYLDWCDSSPLRSCYLLPPLWMIQIPPYKCINGDAYIYVRLKMWGWLFWYNILDDIPGVTLEVGFSFSSLLSSRRFTSPLDLLLCAYSHYLQRLILLLPCAWAFQCLLDNPQILTGRVGLCKKTF